MIDRVIESKKELAKNMVILARHHGFADPWNMPWDLYLDTIQAVDEVIAMEEKQSAA